MKRLKLSKYIKLAVNLIITAMKNKMIQAGIFLALSIITIIIGEIYNWFEKIIKTRLIMNITKFEITMLVVPITVMCILLIYWKYKEIQELIRQFKILKEFNQDISTTKKLVKNIILPRMDKDKLYSILEYHVFEKNNFNITELEKYGINKEIIKKLREKYYSIEIEKEKNK